MLCCSSFSQIIAEAVVDSSPENNPKQRAT